MMSVEAENIIAAVKERPVLWDRQDTDTSRTKYNAAWQQVFNQLIPQYINLPAREQDLQGKLIMKRWRNIKDQYIKTAKKNNKYSQSGRKLKKYLYHDSLTFLDGRGGTPVDNTCLKKETDDDCYHSQNTSNDYLTDENMEYHPQALEFVEPSFPEQLMMAERSTEVAKYTSDSRAATSTYSSDVEDNRHVWFFKSVVPSLADFDDDETLQFQSAVLNTIQDIKKNRKHPS